MFGEKWKRSSIFVESVWKWLWYYVRQFWMIFTDFCFLLVLSLLKSLENSIIEIKKISWDFKR